MGQNSVFEAKPSVLVFAGYEVKKSQNLKLNIKNISANPQRLSILPTSTAFFKAHYNKKGQLAPGMSEVLVISFTPPEWRYYYDCLRILTPAGNINVPIHAYPVLNSQERYIPSLIDLGKCQVGQTLSKALDIPCTVPVTFEYEIKVLEPHPDIQIGPVTGEIPGKSSVSLEINYTPHSASTASCEILFILSEFDFKPLKSRIIASAVHPLPPQSDPETKNLLTGSKENFTKKRLPEISRFTKTVTKMAQNLLAPRTIDRVVYEQQFNTEYRKLEEYDREKEFKIYVSLGNPHPSEEFIEGVYRTREDKEKNRQRDLKIFDLMRNTCAVDADKSIVMTEYMPEALPTWNAYQNDEFSLRQLPLNRFVRAASTIITRLRADNRLKKLKALFAKYSVKTRADVKNLVALDWKQADLVGLGKQDFIPFSFEFNEDILQTEFPEKFTDTLDEFKKNLEIQPLSNFDTYFPMSTIETQDFLLCNYPDMQPVPVSHYVPVERDREYRPCAEEEYSICQEKGDFRDDPVWIQPFNSTKPVAVDPVSLVRPHPSLRCYLTPNAITETSSEFLLTPCEVPRNPYEEFPGNFLPCPYMLSNKWRPKGTYTHPKVPEKMKGGNLADALSESDSDNENQIGLEMPPLETYLAGFEGDDENIKLSLKVNAKAEAVVGLCEEIEKNKQKEIAWLPSQVTLINKSIVEPEFKLSIL